eukprot:COSAG06_NODE_5979_length_3171_cov_20.776693_3_plen_123_part_00
MRGWHSKRHWEQVQSTCRYWCRHRCRHRRPERVLLPKHLLLLLLLLLLNTCREGTATRCRRRDPRVESWRVFDALRHHRQASIRDLLGLSANRYERLWLVVTLQQFGQATRIEKLVGLLLCT